MNHPNAGVLERLLHPRSIAIVGVSAQARSMGGFVLDNLERFGYSGAIHLVSRSDVEVRGRPCVKTPDELPNGVDVAVLAIPETAVADAVAACGARGVGAAVVFASGYAEAGPEGRARQDALAATARDAGVAIVGPNCMGLVNFREGVPLTFETVEPYPGSGEPGVSIVAQSGAMANNIREAMIGRGLPITYSVSTGNEAVLGLEDCIERFVEDRFTRVIAVYAEQVRQPRRFLTLARRARERGKPIVAMLIGRSDRAREAAQSHTGALAGDYATACALLRNEAVIVASTFDELFDVVPILLRHPAPRIGGLAFVTGSGAMKNVALDLGNDLGCGFPSFSETTVRTLRALLPGYAVVENPLDYTTVAMRDPGVMGAVIDTVVADANCGSVIVAQMAGSATNQHDKAEHMVPAIARASKPAALVILGDDGPLQTALVEAVATSGVPFFRSPDRAMRAMALIDRYSGMLRQRRSAAAAPVAPCVMRARDVFPEGGVVAEYRAKAWLANAGVPVPEGTLATDAASAARIAREIGFPVVLKAQAAELPHKSDVGGVIVGVADEESVREAWARMQAGIARRRPDLRLDGILVERMGAKGVELVIGARRDVQWGPVLLVGLGGVWIEALKDVRLLPADADETRIVRELGQLKAAALLEGARGQPPVDVRSVARVVAVVGALMRAMPEIHEIDINPLVVDPDGALLLDALIVCEPNAGEGAA